MTNLKIITKRKISELDLPVFTIPLQQSANISSIVDEIENKKWLYNSSDDQKIIVKFKEIPDHVLVASGLSESGSALYIQKVNMSKTVLDLLKRNRADQFASKIIEDYNENGCFTTIFCDNNTNGIKVWVDKTNCPDAVITACIGNIIIPFSFEDYIFMKNDAAEKFLEFARQLKIPMCFGGVFSSVDCIETSKSMKIDPLPDLSDIYKFAEVILTKDFILEWNQKNAPLILLLCMREKDHNKLKAMKTRIDDINQSIDLLTNTFYND